MGDKIEVKVLVEGGKATPAPPIGPTLAPLKINVGAVVAEINKQTREMAGMQVPVTVIVDVSTKEYSIKVGTPPTSALIKKELKLQKGSEAAGIKRVGDLTPEQAKKVSKIKFGADSEPFVRQVTGTARSMGITVGKGAVTEEEMKKAEDILKARAAEAAPAPAAAGETAPEGEAKEAEGAKEAKGKEAKPVDKKPAEKKK